MIARISRRARFVLVWMAIFAVVGIGAWLRERQGEAITGPARVLDGDSLVIGSAEIRIYGIDAVELYQTCERDGRSWACGRDATQALRTMVAGRDVSCRARERDRYERVVAICRVAELDLGAALVRGGHAVAYGGYAEEEREARQARRGIWSSRFDPPQVWRSRNPRRER